MKIPPIYHKQINNTDYNNSRKKSFTGLNTFLEKSVYALPYQETKRIVDSYDKSSLVVGHFPKDLLALIRKKSNSPEEVKAKIQLFNKSLAEQSKKIIDYENAMLAIAQYKYVEDACYDAITKGRGHIYPFSISYINSLSQYKPKKDVMTYWLNNGNFNETMKQLNIIPEDGEAKFEYAGSGSFKKCFKLSFLDKNKQPIIHSKSFLIYLFPNLDQKCDIIMRKRLEEYIKNTDFNTFRQTMTDRINASGTLSKDEKKKALELIEPFYTDKYKTTYFNNDGIIEEEFFDVNGTFPEANAALKIRKDLGNNIYDSDIITPYIFDLKNNYALCEFADKDITPTKHYYDFEKHHLIWTDERVCNKVNGKLVDFGCISPDTKPYYS